jgi:hypothetical protein
MNTEKIKIINNYPEYQKGQVYNLEAKIASSLLTNGKAIRIHRKANDTTTAIEKIDNKTEIKKSKKNDQEK